MKAKGLLVLFCAFKGFLDNIADKKTELFTA